MVTDCCVCGSFFQCGGERLVCNDCIAAHYEELDNYYEQIIELSITPDVPIDDGVSELPF